MKAYHNSWKSEFREPFGAVNIGSVVHIAIDIESESDVNVALRLWQNNLGESILAMKEEDRFGNIRRFGVDVTMPHDRGLVWYFFKIEECGRTFYYGNNSENLGGEGSMSDCEPQSFQITVYSESETPKWFKEGIAYQIFPDRFARDDDWRIRSEFAIKNRDRSINKEASQKQFIEEDWYKEAYYVKDDEGNVTEWPFYGGSLKGIQEHLDYLKSYGVTVLYLNPVFHAISNHRYDTADYMTIDPILGTEEDFLELVKEADERGISIILDGVFSHTGADSIYFDKYSNFGGNGAYNNKYSQYRYWYKFDDDEECGYKSWWGVKDLPEVDENNAFYRQMICGENGVIRKWMKSGIKGWRLDVADELPDSFIKDIKTAIKAEDRDGVLLGEVWEDASNKISYDELREYLLGKELDSTMNYPLRSILLDYVNYTIGAGESYRRIMNLKENYPKENFYGALNILSSHDRMRILTAMAADEDYNAASSKVKLLTTLQYTLPGVPCIYYGDEVALQGGTDPANRSGFPWGLENLDMAYHFRMLGLIYKEHPALKNGELSFVSANDDAIAFIRNDEDEKILVLTNRSYNDTDINLSSVTDNLNVVGLDLLTSEDIRLDNIHMNRLSSRIVLLREKTVDAVMPEKEAGVICHISSLPGGTLGKPARDFVDWIATAGMKIWQVLPVNPNGIGDCPYNSYAAFAGNPDFINKEELPDNRGYDEFCRNNFYWLKSYVEFSISNSPNFNEYTQEQINSEKLRLLKEQYYFDCQWKDLKKYANSKGIRIMGDLPMFVSAQSADVYGYPDIFLMNRDGTLSVNAGVPPDDFSDDGQNWGSALYDWKALKETGYEWWINRLKQCAERYDILRLDHFRAFSEYYAIPYGKSAKEGAWQNGPGMDFFRDLNKAFAEYDIKLEIIAEDLGLLDAGVKNLIRLTGYPGMDIWQFSYNEMENADPEYQSNRVYYSGTHDNQTLMGWIKSNNPDWPAEAIMKTACDAMEWMYHSNARYVIVQLQDMFLLDDSARMNVPGVAEGNWKWRIPGESIQDAFKISREVAEWFKDLAENSGR